MSQSTTVVSRYILRCIPPRNTSILEKRVRQRILASQPRKVGGVGSGTALLWGCRPAVWRAGGVGDPRRTSRVCWARVSNAADVTRDIPLGDTSKTIKPLSPKIHSFARSCRTWAVEFRYRIRVFLSKAGTVVAE